MNNIKIRHIEPALRKKGVGHTLYEYFFEAAKKAGCAVVRCVTSPANKGSILFHQHLGFSIEPSKKAIDGIPVAENYDGKGGDRILFYRTLGA